MITLIASIFVFSLIILAHEYGHYKAAKSVGICVEEFAIGMGPAIFKKKKNGTIYSIRMFPIGGFVMMEGEEEDIKSSTSFSNKKIWQRFLTIAAGPLMNFILALVLYIAISTIWGSAGNTVDIINENSEIYKSGVRTGDKIVEVNNNKVYIWDDIVYEITEKEQPYNITVNRDGEQLSFDVNQYYKSLIGITTVMDNNVATNTIKTTDTSSPAYKAGIRDNDTIIKINQTEVNSWDGVTKAIGESNDNNINITVKRNDEVLSFNVEPQKSLTLGFNTKIERSFSTVIMSSFYKIGYYIELMFEFLGNLIVGKVGSDQLGGPVQVISMVGETAKMGLYSLLNFAAFISINLGFMNLLPIPALDGSKLVFLTIEKIRGKKIPVEKEGFVHFIGFVVLISFMIFITYKDIIKLMQ